MHGILLSCLCWCFQLLLEIVGSYIKVHMLECWSFTCCILNVASKRSQLKSFLRVLFGRCSSELVQLVPLPYFQGRSPCYFVRLHDFSVTIPRCYKDVYINNFFPCASRLWNSLPIECFPLTYDLNGFKSAFNRHLLAVGSF